MKVNMNRGPKMSENDKGGMVYPELNMKVLGNNVVPTFSI